MSAQRTFIALVFAASFVASPGIAAVAPGTPLLPADPVAAARAAIGLVGGADAGVAAAALDLAQASQASPLEPADLLAPIASLLREGAALAGRIGGPERSGFEEATARVGHAQRLLSAARAGPAPTDVAMALSLAASAASVPERPLAAPLPEVPRFPSASLAARHLLASHGRVPDAGAEAGLARLDALDPAREAALRTLIEAHLFQVEAARLAIEFDDAALLVASRAVVIDAVRETAAVLASPPASASSNGRTLEVCGVIALDLDGRDSDYDCDVAFLVDVGGADTYVNNAGGAIPAGGATLHCVAFVCSPGAPPPGGDCRTLADGTPAPADCPPPTGFLLDVSGNDRYLRDLSWDRPPAECFVALTGGAVIGSGFLFDLEGFDVYDARAHGCQLAATGGANARYRGVAAGFLFDGQGDDVYRVRVTGASPSSAGANGGALHFNSGGNAFLLDGAGRDRYEVVAPHAVANGAGEFGTGALIDLRGATDVRVPGEVYQVAAESACANGAGCRGLGLLYDASGSDVYRVAFAAPKTPGLRTEVAANGAAASSGVGILVDDADRPGSANLFEVSPVAGPAPDGAHVVSNGGALESRRGINLPAGVGLLFSRDAADRYVSHGTGQGAAGNYGIGVLLDGGEANDEFAAFALPGLRHVAQGGGLRLGTGLLLDSGGEARFLLGPATAGQGAGLQGVGLLLRGASAPTTYEADPGSLPSAETGGGTGLRLTRGIGLLTGVAPDFACRSSPELFASPVPEPRKGEIRVCAPDETKKERIQNPATGDPLPDLPKPVIPCTSGPLGQAGCEETVEGIFGDEAADFLESNRFTTAGSGGILLLGDATTQSGRLTLVEADNACRFSCALIWSSLDE